MKRSYLILSLIMCTCMLSEANAGFWFFKKKKAKPVVTAPAPDNTPKGMKPYAQVITGKAKSTKGFVLVHKVDNSYFFEIPDTILGRDILVVNRISKSATGSRRGMMGYAGDEINENVIRFERAPNNKIFIRSVSYAERSQDSTGMSFAVQRSNLLPVMASFEIKAVKKDTVRKKENAVIEVTDFVSNDNNLLCFDEGIKKMMSIGNQMNDRSYIDTIRAYPMNVEIRTLKTYMPKPQGMNDTNTDPFTFLLNSSMVLLPQNPMKARLMDPRVGYFTTSFIDFDKNPQGVERTSLITRWKLEPRDSDVTRYLKGELVEPKKPIVFYIDPATPKKWVPYLIQGVNDWQKAFEKAGFKNAIYALEAPNDPSWSIDDARHSAIVYKPSNIPNASGPHVHDPRSGEIIETHINWYHNVMQLLHDWYFIQAAPIDTAARKMHFSDELMGQLVRFVSSHEVGHTLGLRHNFGSSCTVPVENLRNKAWVEANGHTPSIMDYARFNYVAQPEDNIGRAGIFPRIGIYDEWAIEWGYRWMPEFKTAEDETPYMNKWIIEKLKSDKRFTFGTESDPSDPRNQSEDLGNDAMKASEYGIKNLQRIVPNLLSWTREANKDYSGATEMYNEVVTQFIRYMGHVSKNIAGTYSTPKTVEQEGGQYSFVSTDQQKRAVAFLCKELFNTPAWLINKDLIDKAGADPQGWLARIDRYVFGRIINRSSFERMLQNESMNGKLAYTPQALMADLDANVWKELSSAADIDAYRRNLQKSYVDALILVLADGSTNDASAIARQQLQSLKTKLGTAAARKQGTSKAHLTDLAVRIGQALDPKK